MKLLLLPLLLLAGVGGYGLGGGVETPARAANTGECDSSDCRITVECTDRGTCIVTCFEADGEIRCQQEIECDEPCEKTCDAPCPPSKSCAR